MPPAASAVRCDCNCPRETVRGATGGDIKGAFAGVRDKIEGGAENLGRRARHMVESATDELEQATGSSGGNSGNRGLKRGGKREETGEPSGASVGHKVGRGVVS